MILCRIIFGVGVELVFNNPPQKRLKLVDRYISIYWSILNSPGWIDIINKINKLSYILGDIDSDWLREKEEDKKRVL